MKRCIAIAVVAALPGMALAAGDHAGGHGHGLPIGAPAEAAPSRTVEIVMREDYDGEAVFVFEPGELAFEAGETVRLHLVNAGEQDHEFVMDTPESIAEHKVLMERFPEMEHDEPNAVRLSPGEEADIAWTFENAGTFEFACLLPGHYDGGMHGALTVN